ncbi:MAG: hypothetical protein MR862_02355 [Clostridia bacterium]|nr:hypothetical protein [Clostridia bacterium]
MKNYKMNEERLQDIIFNGYRAVFVLTSKNCKNKDLVKDEPMFEGFDVVSVPQIYAKYLIAKPVQNSRHFRVGNCYAFRITFLGGKKFSLVLATPNERKAISYFQDNERV